MKSSNSILLALLRRLAGSVRPWAPLVLLALTGPALAAPITWTGTAGNGSWHTPSNWDLGRVPGAGDDVSIPDLVGTASVTYNTGPTSINSITCAEVFNLAGGTLTVAAASSIGNTFTFSSGTLNGAGEVVVTTALNWTGGTFSGTGTTTVNAGVSWTLSPTGSQVLSGRTFVNKGTCTLAGTQNLQMNTAAIFRNFAGASLDIQTNAGIVGGAAETVDNQVGATIQKSGGTGTSAIQPNFANGGSFAVSTGTVQFSLGTNNGSMTNSSGTVLDFNAFTFAAGSSLTPAGTVLFRGGTNTIDAASTFTPNIVSVTGGTLTLNPATSIPTLNFTLGTINGPGNVTVTGALNWAGGTFSGAGTTTVNPGVSWTLSPTGSQVLSGRTFVNKGMCTLAGTQNLGMNTAAIFRNFAGASLDIQTNAGIAGGGAETFDNQVGATIQKSGGTGTSSILPNFINGGSLAASTGTVQFTLGTNNGSMTNSSGAVLDFNAFAFAAGSSLTPAGTVLFRGGTNTIDAASTFTPNIVSVTGGTLTLNAATSIPTLNFTLGTINGPGNVTVTGALNWAGGTFSGAGTTTVNPGVSWTLSPTGSQVLSGRTFVNKGTCTLTGSSSLQMNTAAIFRNFAGASLDIQSNAGIAGGTGETVDNQVGATIQKSGGTGTSSILPTFVNGGSLAASMGTVQFNTGTNNGSMTNSSGASLDFASFTFAAGSSLTPAGTVIFRAGTSTVDAGSTFTPNIVTVTGGTLTLNPATSIPTLNFSGGAINGPGNVTVTAALGWTGGSFSGAGTTTVNTGVSWTLIATGTQTLIGRTFVNRGTCTLTGTSSLQMNTAAIFQNFAGASFDIQSNAGVAGGTSETFDNQSGATLQKSAGTGTSLLAPKFVNGGSLAVSTGTLQFNSGTNNGSMTNSSGSVIDISAFAFAAGSSLTSAGTLNFRSGTNTIDAASTFMPNIVTVTSGSLTLGPATNIPTLNFIGGGINGPGNVTVTAAFNWTGGSFSGAGTTTVNPGVSWTLSPSGGQVLSGRTFVNKGACTLTGTSSLQMNTAAIFQNFAGASFDIQSNAGIAGGLTETFDNQSGATLQKSAGTGTSLLAPKFVNGGSLAVSTGTVQFNIGTNNGSMTNGSGAVLDFASFTFAAGSSLTPAGTVIFRAGTNTVDAASTFTPNIVTVTSGSLTLGPATSIPTLNFTNGGINGPGNVTVTAAFNWAGGTFSGAGTTTVNPGVSWTLTPTGSQTLSGRTFVNKGACTLTGVFTLQMNTSAIFQNFAGASFDIQSNAGIAGGTTETFDNQATATFQKTAGIGTSTVSCKFTNDGTVRAMAGTLLQSGSLTNFAAGTLTGGRFEISATYQYTGTDLLTNAATIILDGGSSRLLKTGGIDALPNLASITGAGALTVKNGRTLTLTPLLVTAGQVAVGPGASTLTDNAGYRQTGGATVLSGGTVASSSLVDIQDGTLSGSGTVAGSLRNDGLVAPGASPGAISVTGNYTQTAGGALAEELGGTTPGSGFDVLTVTGTASLNGDLHVSLIDPFVPASGNTFDIVTAGSTSGTFATDNLPLPAGPNCLEVAYLPAAVRLQVLDGVAITGQPLSQRVSAGSPVSFTVVVSGTPVFTFQWRKNGVDIGGATSSTYSIASTVPADAGNYDVVVTNGCGSATSDIATLIIMPMLSIDHVSVPEGNGGTTNAVFTVSLSNTTIDTVRVAYATADSTATLLNGDYVAGSGTLTVLPGAPSGTIVVQVNGDLTNEVDELFLVNLSAPVHATIAGGQGIGTIVNDDGVPVLSIDDVSVAEGDAGTVSAVFTVSLSARTSSTVSVVVNTADGTALASGDYAAVVADTLIFPPKTDSRSVTVLVNGDLMREPNETYTVNLSGAVNAGIADGEGLGTILDEDPVPSVSVADASTPEGNGGTTALQFIVSLSNTSSDTVNVSFGTADSTATVAENDYVASSGTMVFAPGAAADTVTVLVNGDVVPEPDELFRLDLRTPLHATLADSTGIGTIVNDDGTIGVAAEVVPARTYLGAVYPNPFPHRATISFGLKESGPVHLRVFDVEGRMVRSLVDDSEAAGEKQFVWDGLDGAGHPLASGVYLLRLEANGKMLTRSVRVIR